MNACARMLIACLFLFAYASWAQDSLKLYRKIETIASKKKFTHFVYRAIFVEPKTTEYPAQPSTQQGEIINPYLRYQDKLIAHVRVRVGDPFGFQVSDTLSVPQNWLEKSGNRLHVCTKKWVVENKLLFKENEKLDPLALSESERLLRQSTFASDARILVRELDSARVDVIVLVQDKWSITVPIEITTHNFNANLRDRNFLGLGYTFEQYAGYSTPASYVFSGAYSLQNIDNTYISSTLRYRTDNNGTVTGISFDRPFFSPLTLWAGGVSLSHTQHFYEYTDASDGGQKKLSVTNGGLDLWAGRALKILHDGKLLKQSHNLVVSARYFTTKFFERPYPAEDILRSDNNTWGAIGSVGFAVQQFYKNKYIYRFGASEDVPAGLIVQFVYGLQKKEYDYPRFYSGFQVARAGHLPIGYLSGTLTSGIFFNRQYTNDITSRADLYYFSDLIKANRWYVRQFANSYFVRGWHKLYGEKLSLDASDLYGIGGNPMTGNSKWVLRLETVAYAPYNLAGFHIAPVFMAGYGMLGTEDKSVLRSTIYQAYSLGILFRNENLLNSTFQVSFGLYPYDGSGNSYVLKYNPVTSFTIRVRPFLVGKPDFVGY